MHKSTISKIVLPNFVLFIMTAMLLSNAENPGNFKMWDPNNKLTWADYKDTVITGSKRVALTSAGIQMSYKQSDDEVIVMVFSQMNKDKSWVDGAKKSDYVLSHEQYHFNISEYWSRKFKKDLSSGRFTTKNYKEKISDMQKDITAQCKEMQTLYDLETKHSIVKDEQKKWEKQIDDLLKKTENFSDKTVSITLK